MYQKHLVVAAIAALSQSTAPIPAAGPQTYVLRARPDRDASVTYTPQPIDQGAAWRRAGKRRGQRGR